MEAAGYLGPHLAVESKLTEFTVDRIPGGEATRLVRAHVRVSHPAAYPSQGVSTRPGKPPWLWANNYYVTACEPSSRFCLDRLRGTGVIDPLPRTRPQQVRKLQALTARIPATRCATLTTSRRLWARHRQDVRARVDDIADSAAGELIASDRSTRR